MAEVHVADETYLLERLEVAVDGRKIGGRQGSLEPARDLLCADRPLDREESRQHQPPGAGHAQPRCPQECDRSHDITSDTVGPVLRRSFPTSSFRSSATSENGSCSSLSQLRFIRDSEGPWKAGA